LWRRLRQNQPAPAVFTPSIVINVDETYQLRHWAKQYGVTDEELRAAVATVGASAENVRQYFLGLDS
jgi:hypothetical protein